MTVELARYDAACRAVAEAKSVDEAKGLHDKAEAMRAYARQAKNRDLEIDAAEIRMRAERRVGELIILQKQTVGLATGGEYGGRAKIDGSRDEPSNPRPTLADAGIDKKLSSRAQKLAAVPEDEFEGMLGDWRERVAKENERVTTNLLREEDWPDILLEYWSDYERRIPGWVAKDLACDFIAYAFVPSQTCYLLPTLILRRAWQMNGQQWVSTYKRVEANNRTYTTVSVPVPIKTLMGALSNAMTVNWERNAA